MVLSGRDIQKQAVGEVADLLRISGFGNKVGPMETTFLAEIIAQAWNLYPKYAKVLGKIEFEERETDEPEEHRPVAEDVRSREGHREP